MGVIGGLLGLLVLVFMGIFRNIGQNLTMRMGETRARIVLPTVGGLLIGLIGLMFPLTYGDGSLQLSPIFGSYYSSDDDGTDKMVAEFSKEYLIGTIFAKMFTLGISLGFGFIGGQVSSKHLPLNFNHELPHN